ncbi:methyltransferase domain-containing protein [Roseofilum sp. BLCC_M154]|uniref:Methyltransferase domain-containing protein n=1 Tax=Roseofilum acuticapitatum BLCC-M154 TaxID=3022444 RepID=A0ABT7AQM5_9CYAN|nr:class I SAM-dependent methyltransferase [Roseofilum acuticapitatum]MDJ1169194.1 methyltransferase domain-containing protein [Roseofilum acuticapitatum BLCC-M154]
MSKTSQVKTQETLNSFDAIKEAHKLSGKPDEIKDYYDQWSKNYDHDVENEEYCGPEYITAYFDLLPKKLGKFLNLRDPEIEILDAGCGTGLVGVALRRKGYKNIDGFDISSGMVEAAEKTDCYRNLEGGAECDLTGQIEYYADNQYDASISCGVFTLGHVPPTAVEEMIRFTKPGGLVVVSTRKSYYDSTNFQQVCDRLQAEKKVKLVSSIIDGPYIAEEGAHYWAFEVL